MELLFFHALFCLRKRTRHGPADYASIEWVYRRKFEWKRQSL